MYSSNVTNHRVSVRADVFRVLLTAGNDVFKVSLLFHILNSLYVSTHTDHVSRPRVSRFIRTFCSFFLFLVLFLFFSSDLVSNLLVHPSLASELVRPTVEAAHHANPGHRDFVLWATETMADIRPTGLNGTVTQDGVEDEEEVQQQQQQQQEQGEDEEEGDGIEWRLPRCLGITAVLLERTRRWLRDDPALSSLLDR